MKLLVCVAACLFFVQTCFAGLSIMTDADIEEIRTGLKLVPEIEIKTIDDIVNALKKYQNNPIELLSFGLQGDTCTQNNIDFKHIVAIATNTTVDDVIAKYESTGDLAVEFTDNQLNVIESDLNKNHASEKVQFVMEILRGFQKEASMHDVQTAVIDLFTAAAKAIDKGCPNGNSPNQL